MVTLIKDMIILHFLMLLMVHLNRELFKMQNVRFIFLSNLIFLIKALRFTNQGRVSAAVHDNFLQDSPSRLNPNQVLKREREGAHD